MSSLEELFCSVDDFWQSFEPQWQAQQLKNISQIEHSRHRSPVNSMVNVLCGLIAYCHQPKKPELHLEWALPQVA